jgi:Flp pilus assembly protein TadB
MALTGERTEAMREDARRMRESVRRDNVEEKIENVLKERPGARPFFELRPLAIAVGVAVVLALIGGLLFGLAFAGVMLLLGFAATWVIVSMREYSKRRPTQDPEDSPGKGDKEVAPYSS